MKITGNTLLITGGTRGIGRALAHAFHARGNRVIVTGRQRARLDAVTADRPGMYGVQYDLDDAGAPSRLADEMRERFPELNVLIANAGISRSEDLLGDAWDLVAAQAIVETNILGVLRTAAALLPLIKARPDAAFMATGSALAFVPRADFPSYCASKAFLHSWLQSLRHQLRRVPVEVIELSPPYVRTALTGAQQARDPRAMAAGDFAAEVMRLLERGEPAGGELLLERDRPRRWAERDGRYAEVFAALNPAQ